MPRVSYHPNFAAQYKHLCRVNADENLVGEITQLLVALETYGRKIEGEDTDDASHPIVISRYQTYALRRTPPTIHTPYAVHPPVIRIPYVWFRDGAEEFAVVMMMGDKAASPSPNEWYKVAVNRIESQLIPEWERVNPEHQALTRRTR